MNFTDLEYSNRKRQTKEEIVKDEHLSKVDYRINCRPSKLKRYEKYGINWDREIERRKSSVCCKEEHVFLIVKRYFGYRKVVYRGIAKNTNRFHILFGFANLVMCIRTGQQDRFCRAAM